MLKDCLMTSGLALDTSRHWVLGKQWGGDANSITLQDVLCVKKLEVVHEDYYYQGVEETYRSVADFRGRALFMLCNWQYPAVSSSHQRLHELHR